MIFTKEHNRDRSLDKNLQDDWIPDQERRPGATSAELPEYGGDLKEREFIKIEEGTKPDLVSYYMNKEPLSCDKETRIAEIKYLLKKYDTNYLLVLDSAEEKHPIGVVSFDDVNTYEIEHSEMPSDFSAIECMRKIPAVVHRDSTLEECLNIMRNNFVDKLPVVDGNGHLKGVIDREVITQTIM